MAIYEQDVAMFETKENGDKVLKLPVTRANNVEGLGRSANTAYVVGDVVYVDNNKKVALKCKQAGTTSSSELNVSTASIGNVITDGTAKWQVCNRTSDVTSVNGKTGDVVVDVPVQSVNGKTGAVTIAETPYSGSATSIGGASATKPAVVVTTYRSGTSWYRVWSDGWIEQGGYGGNGSKTITLPKAFSNTQYTLVTGNWSPNATDAYTTSVRTKTTTNFTTYMSTTYDGFYWYACGI